MKTHLECPSCDKAFKTAIKPGRKVDCPDCQAVLRVPVREARKDKREVLCPGCGLQLQTLTKPGREMKCRDCGEIFRVPIGEEKQRLHGKTSRPKDATYEAPEDGRSLEASVFNGGVMLGIAAMVAALIWFAVGLAMGVIFVYPPLLFLIGIAAVIKGVFAPPSPAPNRRGPIKTSRNNE